MQQQKEQKATRRYICSEGIKTKNALISAMQLMVTMQIGSSALLLLLVVSLFNVVFIHQTVFPQLLDADGIVNVFDAASLSSGRVKTPRTEKVTEKKTPETVNKRTGGKTSDQASLLASQGRDKIDASVNRAGALEKKKEQPGKTSPGGHRVAGLSCKKYGGPSDEDAAEMVYWRDIPEDEGFVSPFKRRNETQYLTFEPDIAGWNNVRMSMETAVTMAIAMGRTLVMPPAQTLLNLNDTEKNQKSTFAFTDFFHFDSIEREHAGLEIITTEEFLKREVMTGNIRNTTTGKPIFPPDNRTNWDGVAHPLSKNPKSKEEAWNLKLFSREIGFASPWNSDDCMAAFPSQPNDVLGEKRLNEMITNVINIDHGKRLNGMFINKPVPVDASASDRLRENRAHRKRLCVYTPELQKHKVFHLMGDWESKARIFVYFYAFLFFEDWRQDLWTKRFIRDHLRYKDEIQCAAARIVSAMREISRKNGNHGVFDTFHIRRGDFLDYFKKTRTTGKDIVDTTLDLLKANSTIYIATDERDKAFFEPFRKRYKIYFMEDFKHLLEGINTNYYGMIDQLVASRGRTFIGTFYSTFTGYINRVRGYHSQMAKAKGWELGIIDSYYYIPVDKKNEMRKYRPISPPLWRKEFAVGWRDLDKGVGELPTEASP